MEWIGLDWIERGRGSKQVSERVSKQASTPLRYGNGNGNSGGYVYVAIRSTGRWGWR